MKTDSVVTVGTFDGVHLGHRAVLVEVARLARENAAESVAYVFESPPRTTLEGGPSSPLLLPIDLRRRLLRTFVSRVDLARFASIRHLPPRAFAEEILVDRLRARDVVVGEGFRFGRGRRGDVPLLQSCGRELGFEVRSVPPAEVDGKPVSSTRIRRLLVRGDVREAAELLGRPPILSGRVVRGEGVGRRLGFPTANLALDPRVLLPADGIYLAHVFAGGGRFHGLLYVGRRPTLEGGDRRCEVHVLSEPDEPLYRRTMQAHLLERLRGDRAFSSLEALRDRIARDVEAARGLVSRHPLPRGPVGG